MSLIAEVGLGFLVGAFAVPSLSLSADRFGSKLAGAFGGFPATIASSLFFLGLAKGPHAASEAASVIPVMEGIFGIFLGVFAMLVHRSLSLSLFIALGLWAILTCVPLFIIKFTIVESAIALLLCLLASLFFLERKIHVSSVSGKIIRLSYRDIGTRMITGGSVVALAIYLGSTMGPVVGGVIASIPAVVVSTLIVLYKTSGPDSAAAFSKALLINALVNTGVFSVTVHFMFLKFGIVGGTIAGLAATTISGLLCWVYTKEKLS